MCFCLFSLPGFALVRSMWTDNASRLEQVLFMKASRINPLEFN